MNQRVLIQGSRGVVRAAALATVVSLPALGLGASPAAATEPVTTRFGCTRSSDTYIVPAGVRALTIALAGASGGTTRVGYGQGGHVTATVAVEPGAALTVVVGCADGYNGGGLSPYSHNGGGASDVRTGTGTLADRILVAGGGGGRGSLGQTGHLSDSQGGHGGYAATSGESVTDLKSGGTASGGGGATSARGGNGGSASGADCAVHSWAQDGASGAGGIGAYSIRGIGGGGGGGYFGGGGGGASCNVGGGGGGGSSFGPVGAVFTTGGNVGDGYVEITPVAASAPTTVGSAAASDDCAAGSSLMDIWGWQGSVVRAWSVQPDAQTLWVCVRVETSAGNFGGKLVVSQPTGINGVPTVDGADTSCSTQPGNLVPTPHPILSGAVGDPGDPATYLPYLLDAYSNGSSAWLCVRAGSVGRRIVVPAGAGVTPAVVTFVADPPTVPATAAPAPPAMPSGECQRPLPAGTRYLDATVAETRVYLYTESPSATSRRICVRADGAVGAGGALTVDHGGGNGLVPTVETSTTDMSPCTVQVFHNDNPAIDIRRSATGAVPASVCVTVGGESLRVTLGTGSGQMPASVTWQPDPGTPGA